MPRSRRKPWLVFGDSAPLLALCLTSAALGCAGDEGSPPGTPAAGTAGQVAAAGRGGAGTSAAPGQAGQRSAAGSGGGGRGSNVATGPDMVAGRGASAGRSAGAAGAAATSGKAGAGGAPSSGPIEPLDCGPNGVAIENAGPPKNRVNYVVVGDGYTAAQQDLFVEHLQIAMKKRFSEVIGQPYGRYRKFVNICGIKLVSDTGPIGSGATALDCSGDDQSRLARCNTMKANAAIADNVPDGFEVDWKAVVLNNDRWWNTGAVLMLWSGAHEEAAGAALHEGGHGFHQLADEYDGTESNCSREFGEVNVTADSAQTAGKWDLWLGYDQVGATGLQGATAGARYCRSGQFRPSQNSMMNQLFGSKPNTAYNPVSREKMIMDIWRVVTPVDATEPAAGPLTAAGKLEVKVIDPAVIDVDWSIDDKVIAAKGGTSFDLAAQNLGAGKHTITAKAYDNAGEDLVRYKTGMQFGRMNWARSEQTVSWTIEVP